MQISFRDGLLWHSSKAITPDEPIFIVFLNSFSLLYDFNVSTIWGCKTILWNQIEDNRYNNLFYYFLKSRTIINFPWSDNLTQTIALHYIAIIFLLFCLGYQHYMHGIELIAIKRLFEIWFVHTQNMSQCVFHDGSHCIQNDRKYLVLKESNSHTSMQTMTFNYLFIFVLTTVNLSFNYNVLIVVLKSRRAVLDFSNVGLIYYSKKASWQNRSDLFYLALKPMMFFRGIAYTYVEYIFGGAKTFDGVNSRTISVYQTAVIQNTCIVLLMWRKKH